MNDDGHCERANPQRGPARSHSEAISAVVGRRLLRAEKTALAMTRDRNIVGGADV